MAGRNEVEGPYATAWSRSDSWPVVFQSAVKVKFPTDALAFVWFKFLHKVPENTSSNVIPEPSGQRMRISFPVIHKFRYIK